MLFRSNGYKEDIASVKTEAGPGFEVWSLVGEVGRRFVIPTQVMLVGDSLIKFHQPRNSNEAIFALTSLSPRQSNPEHARKCLESWRHAGLEIRSFNHPSEIHELRKLFDIEFVPVEQTSIQTFGAHYIPINAFLQWAAEEDASVLLINSDIELRFEPPEMKRIQSLSSDGLCYFVRFNYDGDYGTAMKEWNGIDAFLLHGRDSDLFSPSFLSMGKPYWDYWLPHMFNSRGRAVYAVEFPATFHLNHNGRWSWTEWLTCAIEFQRVIGERHPVRTFQACHGLAHRERSNINRHMISLSEESVRTRITQIASASSVANYL